MSPVERVRSVLGPKCPVTDLSGISAEWQRPASSLATDPKGAVIMTSATVLAGVMAS